MKIKIAFLSIVFLSCFTSLVAQHISLGFVKNCIAYKRTVYTDEMKQKHFLLVQDRVESPSNPTLAGASYYSNSNKQNVSPGEIKVLSLITDKIKITEIIFTKEYFNNYNDVFKQMVSFFKNQESFKNEKYKTDVAKFSKDGVFYYAYKNGEIPVIVISDKKLEDTYFK